MITFKSFRLRTRLALLLAPVLLVALVAGIVGGRHVEAYLDQEARYLFGLNCADIQDKIEDRLKEHAQILSSAAAFFEVSDDVTRQKWQRFIAYQKFDQHLPGIQGVGFALLIPRDKLEQHIKEICAEGFPEYTVRPAGERALYSSIIYLEPFSDRNLRAFGYDMLSEPVRRVAMERARDLNVPTLSGKVRLVQETAQDVQAGTLMYMPVYQHRMPIETVDQRRAAIRGWVYSPYRMGDLMAGILGFEKIKRIHLTVFDGETTNPDALLYDSQPEQGKPVGADTGLRLQQLVVVANRPWIICFTSMENQNAVTGWVVVSGVSMLSMLLAGFIFNLFTTRITAEYIARKLTKELRASEYRWKFAVEGTGDGLWDWDVPTGSVFFSDRWKQMLNLTDTEAGNSIDDWRKCVHPEDLPSTMIAVQAHVDGQTTTYANEHRVRCKDGHWKWILDRGLVVSRDVDGKPLRMIGTHTDITERKRNEMEKNRLEFELRQAQKMEAVGRLAGGVAHDFNNLLMGIMGYADLCRDAVEPNHPIREYLDEIVSSVQRSAEITRQLLAFARKQTIAPKILDLNDAVSGMLKLLRRLIGEDIELTWRPGADLRPIKIDPSQIDQILANLCVNARDAITGVGEITLETGNSIIDSEYCTRHMDAIPGEYVFLAVSDNGCGMSKDTLAQVFEPFFTTKGLAKGTGLGLATVYGIVKQNNGFIYAYSESHKGTTFKIFLPQIAAEADAPVTSKAEAPRGQGEAVLLVEDEKSLRVTCGLFLKALGYKVLVAETPEEALKMVSQYSDDIHVLLTDVVMPGMDGRQLATRVIAVKPSVKVLFMSGYTADVIAKRGVLDEGVHFLAKPFTRGDLARKLHDVLEK